MSIQIVPLYKQIWGCAMGSLVSPIIANLYMEQFERKAFLSTFPRPPEICYRYVDDTAQIRCRSFYGSPKHIQFTIEPERRKVTFLGHLCTAVHIKEDRTTKVTIYRKPTHTDLYLNFDSNHHLEHKRTVVRTLFQRARTGITEG